MAGGKENQEAAKGGKAGCDLALAIPLDGALCSTIDSLRRLLVSKKREKRKKGWGNWFSRTTRKGQKRYRRWVRMRQTARESDIGPAYEGAVKREERNAMGYGGSEGEKKEVVERR
jgi:hypothetical protein